MRRWNTPSASAAPQSRSTRKATSGSTQTSASTGACTAHSNGETRRMAATEKPSGTSKSGVASAFSFITGVSIREARKTRTASRSWSRPVRYQAPSRKKMP